MNSESIKKYTQGDSPQSFWHVKDGERMNEKESSLRSQVKRGREGEEEK